MTLYPTEVQVPTGQGLTHKFLGDSQPGSDNSTPPPTQHTHTHSNWCPRGPSNPMYHPGGNAEGHMSHKKKINGEGER